MKTITVIILLFIFWCGEPIYYLLTKKKNHENKH